METPANEPVVLQKTIYRSGMRYVELKLSGMASFAEVRVWRGHRWPDLERVWYARMRRWIPWFSLERQALRAVEYVAHAPPSTAERAALTREVRAAVNAHRAMAASR